MKALHITQWDTLYESHESRKVETLSYYRKSNKLVGLGIGRTLQVDPAEGRGLMFMGVWALLEALASLGARGERGWLVRNGKPLTAREIAYLLRVPENPVDEAIKHFLNPEIGWLEQAEFPGTTSRQKSAAPGKSHNGREDAGTTSRQKSARGKSAGGNREDFANTDLLTDKRLTEGKKKKENGGFADAGTARAAQAQQFAAADARRRELEATPEDERTEGQEAELKKMRALVREIQRKQTRGDFTPVAEEAVA